jgi:Tfp pilus assembly protein PilF
MTSRQCRMRVVLFLTPVSALVGVSWGQQRHGLDDGTLAMARGDYKAAEAHYQRALEQSPGSPELLSNLGITLEMQGKSSQANQAFEEALKQKQMPRTYALLAEEKCKTLDPTLADADYTHD